MPGHELKRNSSQLSSLFKSFPGKAGACCAQHMAPPLSMGGSGRSLVWALARALVPVDRKSLSEKMPSVMPGRQLWAGAVAFRP